MWRCNSTGMPNKNRLWRQNIKSSAKNVALGAFSLVLYYTLSLRFLSCSHRISIQQEGKRGGGGSSSLKLNLTDPYRTWGMLGRRAGSTVSIYAQVQCREPKTGQQKVQFYFEDEIHWQSGYSLSMHAAHSGIRKTVDNYCYEIICLVYSTVQCIQ